MFLVVLLLVSFSCVAYASDTVAGDTDGMLSKAWDFVVGLVLPDEDYFPNQMQRLQVSVDEKMGGIGYLYNMVEDFFTKLNDTKASTPLIFSIPDNFLYHGYQGLSIDFLASGAVYVRFLRSFLNVLICLGTAFVCYKKLITLFSS